MMLLNYTIAYGKAGPTQAALQTQSIFLLLLEIMFLAKLPTTLQTLGMALGITGALVMSLGHK